ncbi:hypothetical protein EBR57_04750, partial [bacterium]|nr:hypothetical protein [bacterium]
YQQDCLDELKTLSNKIQTLCKGLFLEEYLGTIVVNGTATKEDAYIPKIKFDTSPLKAPDGDSTAPPASTKKTPKKASNTQHEAVFRTDEAGARRNKRLLSRIATMRLFATTFRQDHHARLIMAYVASQFFEHSNTREFRRELSRRIHQWEGQKSIDECAHPHLIPAIDPFLNQTDTVLTQCLTSNRSPLNYEMKREDMATFFSHFYFLGTVQNAVSMAIQDSSGNLIEPVDETATQVLATSRAVAKPFEKVSSILTSFIESNLSSSLLPTDQATGTSRILLDAVWLCMHTIKSPDRTMLGILEVEVPDQTDFQSPPHTDSCIVLSCSGRGIGLDYIQNALLAHSTELENADIQLYTSSDLAISTTLATADMRDPILRLIEVLKRKNIRAIYFETSIPDNPDIVHTAKVAKDGSITTHNGVSCAYGKLYRLFQQRLIHGTPVGIFEKWFDPSPANKIETPFPEAMMPKSVRKANAAFDEAKREATEEFSRSNDLPLVAQAQSRLVKTAESESDSPSIGTDPDSLGQMSRGSLFASNPSIETFSALLSEDSPEISTPRRRTDAESRSSMSSGRTTEPRRWVSSQSYMDSSAALSNTPPNSNAGGLGFGAKSCFGCQFNKYFLAQKLVQIGAIEPPDIELSPSSREIELRSHRVSHRVEVTPGSASKPSNLDISFGEVTPEYNESAVGPELTKDRKSIIDTYSLIQEGINDESSTAAEKDSYKKILKYIVALGQSRGIEFPKPQKSNTQLKSVAQKINFG